MTCQSNELAADLGALPCAPVWSLQAAPMAGGRRGRCRSQPKVSYLRSSDRDSVGGRELNGDPARRARRTDIVKSHSKKVLLAAGRDVDRRLTWHADAVVSQRPEHKTLTVCQRPVARSICLTWTQAYPHTMNGQHGFFAGKTLVFESRIAVAADQIWTSGEPKKVARRRSFFAARNGAAVSTAGQSAGYRDTRRRGPWNRSRTVRLPPVGSVR